MANIPRGHRMSPLDHEPDAVIYARKMAGFRQAEAASRLGHSPSYLSEIEKGTRNAGHALLQKMANLYNCPVVILQRSIHTDVAS